MKIVTWNIQWALGVDGRCDPARIVAEARRLADFDVLCLQEVADGFPDLEGSGARDQFAAFAGLLPDYTAVVGVANDLPAPDGGRRRFGNMILSRLPVDQVLRHQLPWEADATENMPRLLLEATVLAPFGPLRVMTTHLEWSSPRLRAAQVEAIRSVHRQAAERRLTPRQTRKGPYQAVAATASAILTGDFNMRPEDPTVARLQQPIGAGVPALRDVWTRLNPGAPHPHSFYLHDRSGPEPHCVDYVLASDDLAPRLLAVTYDRTSQASDHQPVILELAD